MYTYSSIDGLIFPSNAIFSKVAGIHQSRSLQMISSADVMINPRCISKLR
jgi:hypothetical protein